MPQEEENMKLTTIALASAFALFEANRGAIQGGHKK